MKGLKTSIKRIIVIMLTINLIVFSAIPKINIVYGDTPTTELQSQIVEYAKKWVGVTPYVWGGESLTEGADCSGFVMQIYKQFGIDLPHGTASLINVGTEVSWSDVQLGDVIITISEANTETSRHTGIYAGDGKWVNASNFSLGTVLNNINPDKIETIRRIVGNLQSDGKTPTVYPGQDGTEDWSVSGSANKGQVDNTHDKPVDLDNLVFDFSGSPSKMEYNGKKDLSVWVFVKFSQFVDLIIGIMLQCIKGAIVGWTSIIEGMVSDVLDSLNN